MLMLTQIYEAASGSYVALRINLVILKELNLGNLGLQMWTARAVSIQEKVEWFHL